MADDHKRSDKEMRQEARIVNLTSSEASAPDAGLPVEAHGLIGHQLREEYRRVLAEPLPDKFKLLLDELAKSSAGQDEESKK